MRAYSQRMVTIERIATSVIKGEWRGRYRAFTPKTRMLCRWADIGRVFIIFILGKEAEGITRNCTIGT